MNKKKTFFTTLILALLTTAMAYLYFSEVAAESANVPEIETTQVVTVVSTIPAHVRVTEEMLEMKEVPAEGVHPQALKSTDEVVGAMTKTELIVGEPVLSERLILAETDSVLSYRIPESMRAITIPATETMGLAGYLVTGDRVDIIVAYTRKLENEEDKPADEEQEEETKVYTQMQNVEILATGPNQPVVEGGETIPTSLTLLVSPEQAEVITYANMDGSFHLTLRNPADTAKEELEGYGEDNFTDWKER